MNEEKEKRSKRIQQKDRSKKKNRKIANRMTAPTDCWIIPSERDERVRRIAGMLTNHGKLCSCHMCGNPRKWFNEKTMQEKKIDQEDVCYGNGNE